MKDFCNAVTVCLCGSKLTAKHYFSVSTVVLGSGLKLPKVNLIPSLKIKMNNYCNIALAVVLVILCEVNLGNSIECYQCHSERDTDCTADIPDVKYLTNCSTLKKGPQYTACRKIENNVDFTVLGQKPTRRIIRQCAADVDKDRPCYYRAGFGGRANVCDCFESKCNYASAFINSILVTAMCAIAALVFL